MAQSISVDNIAAPQSTSGIGNQRVIPILIGLMLGMLLAALDQTIVGTAMPHIVSQLGGASELSWVYTSYLLATTVCVPIYGKLSDIYGRRIFFMGGMILFLIGSALSGTSQNMTQLILYRGIQGLGAGAIMPIAQAILGDIFPPSERGKWQGLFIAVFGLATIVGPLLGGTITDNFGWRWVFYINMPVGAIALITAGFTLPSFFQKRKHTIDVIGSIALVLWAVPLLLAVSFGGNKWDWGSYQSIALFGGAALMFIIFLVIELRSKEPIISPSLFRSGIFTISTISMFLLSAGMFGAIAYLPYFVQDVLGQSATNSGLVLTPMMVGFMVSSIIGGQLLSRTGRYKILALVGYVVACAGMFLLSQMGVGTTNDVLIRNMLITGLGIGVMISLFTVVVQNAFPPSKIGEVTSTLTFFRTMGSTIGLAVLGTILTSGFKSNLQANLPDPFKPYISQFTNLSQNSSSSSAQGLPPAVQQQLAAIVKLSFANAISEVFLLSTAAMALAFFVTLFLREIPLRRTNAPATDLPAEVREAELESEMLASQLPI